MTPTSSAVAVAAVRRGLRTALLTASREGTPPNARVARPSRRTTAGTNSGPLASTPRKESAPPATPATIPPNRAPSSITAVPTTTDTAARISRRWPVRDRKSGADSGRSAASGETRVARRAGASAATTVVAIPTATGSASSAGDTCTPSMGMPTPTSVSTQAARTAAPVPATAPPDRSHRAQDRRLSDHRPDQLTAARSHAPQQRELAGALGQHDRERVGDHECRDERRHPSEAQQEYTEDVHATGQAPGDLGGASVGRQHRCVPAGELSQRGGDHAGAILVAVGRGPDEHLGVSRRPAAPSRDGLLGGYRGALIAERSSREYADDRGRLATALGIADRQGRTRSELVVLGPGGIDGDLAWRPRQPARTDLLPAQGRIRRESGQGEPTRAYVPPIDDTYARVGNPGGSGNAVELTKPVEPRPGSPPRNRARPRGRPVRTARRPRSSSLP